MLMNQATDLREQLQGASIKAQDSENALAVSCFLVHHLFCVFRFLPSWNISFLLQDLSEQYDMEKSELFSHIEILEKELYSLSSSSLSREKESLRKDLDKTKTKLKETESKFKNVMQEKTRLEVHSYLLELYLA